MSDSPKSDLLKLLVAGTIISAGALLAYGVTASTKERKTDTSSKLGKRKRFKKAYAPIAIALVSGIAFGATQVAVRKMIANRWDDFLEGEIPGNF